MKTSLKLLVLYLINIAALGCKVRTDIGNTALAEEAYSEITEYRQQDLKEVMNQIIVVALDDAVLELSKRDMPVYKPNDLKNDELVFRFTQQIQKFHRKIENEDVVGIAYDIGFHTKMMDEISATILNKTSIPTVWTARLEGGDRMVSGMQVRPSKATRIKFGAAKMLLGENAATFNPHEFDFPVIPYALTEISNAYSSHRYPPVIRIQSLNEIWFQTISMADIISERTPTSVLVGKHVLVGVTLTDVDEKNLQTEKINGIYFHALATAVLMKYGEYIRLGLNTKGYRKNELVIVK